MATIGSSLRSVTVSEHRRAANRAEATHDQVDRLVERRWAANVPTVRS
jgi:hypothetical protein